MRLQILVSTTTLKRIWGYLNDAVEARESTLGILSQFLGYRDWKDYCASSAQPDEPQSSPVFSRRLSVAEQLNVGDCLSLSWHPSRVCRVRYVGELTFLVLESVNTRLKAGDTFLCSLIIEGEPLYIDNLRQQNKPPVAYVCGKKAGVKFELEK